MYSWYRKLSLKLNIVHEIWHYLAARALGVRAELHPTHVRIWTKNPWKSITVTLAPIVVGFLLWLIFVVMSLNAQSRGMLFLSFVFLILWQIGCIYDYRNLWRKIRRLNGKGGAGAEPTDPVASP